MPMEILLKTCIVCILVSLLGGCKKSSYTENGEVESLPNRIDINNTELLQSLFENDQKNDYGNIYNDLREYGYVPYTKMRTHFKNLKNLPPDSITKIYGSPIKDIEVVNFRPAHYDETFSAGGYITKEDYVYTELVRSNTVTMSEYLVRILSRIDEFTIGCLRWNFNDSVDMEIIYLFSDTTMIPINGWIANKEHFVFNRG